MLSSPGKKSTDKYVFIPLEVLFFTMWRGTHCVSEYAYTGRYGLRT